MRTLGTKGHRISKSLNMLYMFLHHRYFNVNEVLDILEEDVTFQQTDVYIQPPPVDELTDEDSGDEDEGAAIQNLNGRQLSARATATISYPHGRETVGKTEENGTSDKFKETKLTT